VQASKKEIEEPLVRRFNVAQPATPAGKPEPMAAEPSASEPPKVQLASGSGEAISGLASSAVTMPTLGVPVSQGVTPLVLVRRVTPKYPAQALSQRLEGAVVVHAFVDVTGKVSRVEVVSGSPLLGQSAMDAVKEWRYRPSLLNGKPVASETRITINFQAAGAR
jgi:protein TonB